MDILITRNKDYSRITSYTSVNRTNFFVRMTWQLEQTDKWLAFTWVFWKKFWRACISFNILVARFLYWGYRLETAGFRKTVFGE